MILVRTAPFSPGRRDDLNRGKRSQRTFRELRDRTYENQRHRAIGLNLVVAAIVLWNTVYIERAVKTLGDRAQANSDDLLAHLSPLGWEHINLTGDHVWKPDGGSTQRPLRQLRLPISADEPNP
jgi:hypothetical protein